MARVRYRADLPDDVAVAFEQAQFDRAEKAAVAVGGWQDQRVRLGPTVLRIRTTGGPLVDRVARAFGPLLLAGEGPADAELLAWDSTGTGVGRPAPEWVLPGRFVGAGGIFTFDIDNPQMTACRPADATAVVWMPDAAKPAPGEVAAPFRQVIDQLLGDRGTVFVHGGVVAVDGRGLLLTALGGSGKSTTVMACTAAGMQTLGDDFVLIESPGGDGVGDTAAAGAWRASALYATARLLPTSPFWTLLNGDQRDAVDPVDATGKHLVQLAELFPGRFIGSTELVAVVVPRHTHDDPVPGFTPVAPATALRALAPTSLSLTEMRPAAFAAMRSLCQTRPCFELRVTSDLAATVATVRELLATIP